MRGAATALGVFLVLVATSVALAAEKPPEMGRYIVVLESSIDEPGAVGQAQVGPRGGKLGFVYHYAPIGYSAALPTDAVEGLRKDPRVRAVRPDGVDAALTQTTSTGIKRIGAFANKALLINESNDYTINADVAVIDAGVSAKETDINILKRVYCTGNLMSATCTEGVGNDEASGHGTLVTSTLGAIDNKEGVVGVAPGVRIWSAKVLDPKALESEVVAALNWVIENAKSIEVVNMSLGCETLPCTRTSASEAMTKAIEAGVVVVIAAGNETSDASKSDYAKNPTAITVSGAADYDGAAGGTATSWWLASCNPVKQGGDTGKKGEDDQSYTESNFGTVIDIAAPAVCIRGEMPEDRGGGLGWGTGTSFAAPQVSGAAAILAAQSNPENKANVEAIRNSIVVAGTLSFKDNSGDSVQEKMLELSDEKTFK